MRPSRLGSGGVVRLELDPCAALDEQSLEHVLDPGRRPEVPLDVRAAAAGADDSEVARVDMDDPFRVEHDRNAGREVRLAADQLAAALDLDDDLLGWDELGHCLISLRSASGVAAQVQPELARSWHRAGTDTSQVLA